MKYLLGLSLLLWASASFRKMATHADGTPLPVMETKAFVAKYLIVNQETGTSKYGREQYDLTQNKASMTIIDGDNAVLVIMDYTKQTVASIEYSASTNIATKCDIMSMTYVMSGQASSKDNFHILGGFQNAPSSKNVPKLFTAKYIFTLNNSRSFDYKGNATIDGITANHWSTDMEWPDDKAKFTVHYYFTKDDDWKSAESSQSSRVYPLRIAVNGAKDAGDGKTKVKINRSYEYLDLKMVDEMPRDAFDYPEGTACTHYPPEKSAPMPTLPDVFSYRRERIDEKGNVYTEDVTHDGKAGLMSINYDLKEVIYDFNTGVAYTVSNYNCQMAGIDSLDGKANVNGLYKYVQDIGPLEFWLLNQTYTYEGTRLTRLIDSSSWGGNLNQQMFDVHFANLNWQFKGHDSNSKVPVPLSLVRNGVRYNFFNFRETANHLSHPHVASCTRVGWRGQVVFRTDETGQWHWVGDKAGGGSYMRVKVTSKSLLSDKNIKDFSDAVANVAGISPFQVVINKFNSVWDGSSSLLSLSVSLYDPPSPQSMFRHYPKRAVESSNLTQTKSVTLPMKDVDQAINEGASVCNTMSLSGDFECRSYDLCKNNDGSYNVKMHLSLPANTSLVTRVSCDYFMRSVDRKPPVPLIKATKAFTDAVEKGGLTADIILIGDYSQKFTAISSKRNIPLYEKINIQKFAIIPYGYSITTTEEVGDAQTSTDCESNCLGRNAYQCQAFQFCESTQQCFLSKFAVHKNATKQPYNCFIYKRTNIADFKMIPGKTIMSQSKTGLNVKTADSCAMECRKSNDFNCESFDFCAKSGVCYLSKTHFYSLPPNQQISATSQECYHFSKNYLLDYDVAEKTGLVVSDSSKFQTIAASTAEQCAYLCRTGYDGQGCVQFDYCSDTKKCHIVSDKASKKRAAYTGDANCRVFTLTNAPTVSSSGKVVQKETKGSGKTYSDASFAGLAIAMTVIGLAIGGFVMAVLYRRNVLSKLV